MRLLIVGCSKAKSAAPGLLPARERYSGTCWKVIRRALRDCPVLDQELDILVISAEFGAIDSRHLIPWYERRMTRARAGQLREQIVTTINAHLMQRHYDDILICLGTDYRRAIAGAHLGFAHTTTGGIGEQARQLKQWLHGSSFGCEKE
jgi:hypothetical protein